MIYIDHFFGWILKDEPEFSKNSRMTEGTGWIVLV
jgi:hypothetical protein